MNEASLNTILDHVWNSALDASNSPDFRSDTGELNEDAYLTYKRNIFDRTAADIRQLGRRMKQTIPPHTVTQLVDRPDMTVVQRSEGNSWVEVQPDGSLLLGPLEGAMCEWQAYQRSEP